MRLVVFGDDWKRHPSSMQHLVRNLLDRYEVDWVNTIGTRLPSLTMADMQRVVAKLKAFAAGTTRPAGDPPTLRVHSPVMLPRLRTQAERRINGALLRKVLRPILETPPFPTAVVTMVPVVADLARRTSHLNWIYYCADDLSAWPGLDGPSLQEMELELLPHMKRTIVVSEHLRERLAGFGTQSTILTHGVDLEHWCMVRGRGGHRGEGKVRALYFGLADRRLDAEICLALADKVELVFVGPLQNVDPRLLAHPNVRWTGPVPFAQLPEMANQADVLVMPYADLPVTRAMQPLKLKEYLATTMPVVVTPLPANRAWADAADIAAEPERFVSLVLERASQPIPKSQLAARARLAAESWKAKSLVLEREILARAEPEARARAV